MPDKRCECCGDRFDGCDSLGSDMDLCQMCWEDFAGSAWWSEINRAPVCPHCGETGPFKPQGFCQKGHQQQ